MRHALLLPLLAFACDLPEVPGETCEISDATAWCRHDPSVPGPSAGQACDPPDFPATAEAGKLRQRCSDGRLLLADADPAEGIQHTFTADGEHLATRYYAATSSYCGGFVFDYGPVSACLDPCALDPGTDLPDCDP